MKHHHVRRKGWFCWIKNDTKDGNKIWSGSRVGVKGPHRPLLPFIFILVSSSTLRFCCWYMFKKKPCVGNCCHHHSQPARKGFDGPWHNREIHMYVWIFEITTNTFSNSDKYKLSEFGLIFLFKKKLRLFLDNFTQEFQDDRKNQYDRRTNFGLTFHLINL